MANNHHSASKKSCHAPWIVKEITQIQCTPLLGIFHQCRRHPKHNSIWFRLPETPRRCSRHAIYHTLLGTALKTQAITNPAHRSRPDHRSKSHVSPLGQLAAQRLPQQQHPVLPLCNRFRATTILFPHRQRLRVFPC